MVRHPAVDMISFTGSTAVGKMTVATAAETSEARLDGARRQEPAARVRRRRPRGRRSMPSCSASTSTPANAAIRAAACSSSARSPRHSSAEIVARSRGRPGRRPSRRARRRSAPSSAPSISARSRASSPVRRPPVLRFGSAASGWRPSAAGSWPRPWWQASRPTMAIAREEVFGPVLSVLTFDTVDEAVSLANGTELRPVGRRVEPRLRHLPDSGARHPRRHGLAQHLHGRLCRAAVRRLRRERDRARARPARGRWTTPR